MKTIKFKLEELTCPTCIAKIETVLNKQSGVTKAKVLFNTSQVKVDFDADVVSGDVLAELIEKTGYPVRSRAERDRR
ncbi:MAG TPA: heavy-metal-associated domain-containing protein [Sphingobacteriaceae bacterium]|nr:heavy-metal-associated domain-containing protein [Sphingobacteriaceae bacterium]